MTKVSRQVRRATERRQAKIDGGNARVKARKATREAKGLQPLSRSQAVGYPKSRGRTNG